MLMLCREFAGAAIRIDASRYRRGREQTIVAQSGGHMQFSGIDRTCAAHLRGALIAGTGVDKDALRRDCRRLYTEWSRRRDRWGHEYRQHDRRCGANEPRHTRADHVSHMDFWRVVGRLSAGSILASHALQWNDDCIVQCECDAK